MSQEVDLPITMIAWDTQFCKLLASLDVESALTLVGVISEDPADWSEASDYWSRYRTQAVPESLSYLPNENCELDRAISAISDHGNWIAIDFVGKRVFVGAEVEPIGRDAVLVLMVDEKGKQRCPLPIHLPPWWELHEGVDASQVMKPRQTPIKIPHTDRWLLFGTPMVQDLTARILRIAAAGRLPPESSESEDDAGGRATANALHRLTVEVHREWLMTPRQDLNGRKPRDLLHGAHRWNELVTQGQRMRFEDGLPMIAAPVDVLGYEKAPMGQEEMIMYFDLCRELIAVGWDWCGNPIDRAGRPCERNRSDILEWYLSEARDRWLNEPYEGGSPPSFIIECSRRRVPRGVNVPIIGMDECEREEHIPDCNCPVCEMMQSGMFGVSFCGLDGYHLDLDGEFAFSTEESYEDWELTQGCWEESDDAAEPRSSLKRVNSSDDDEYDDDEYDDDEQDDDEEEDGDEEHEVEDEVSSTGQNESSNPQETASSVWNSPMAEGPLPGDRQGSLKLAFRLTEIVGDLERLSVPVEVIKNLNSHFREYWQSDCSLQRATKVPLFETLEEIGQQFPELLPKLVDFQSLVDELQRQPAS